MLIENELTILNGKQFLITSYVDEKLAILNFIKGGYDEDIRPMMNSRFLLFTGHVYYRSIIIDLCALFVDRSVERQTFHRLYKKPECGQHLLPQAMSQIKQLLVDNASNTNTIAALRDQQYAHYDFTEDAIKFNFDHIPTLNALLDTAKQILNICGSERIDASQTCDYTFHSDGYLHSLKILINHPDTSPPLV